MFYLWNFTRVQRFRIFDFRIVFVQFQIGSKTEKVDEFLSFENLYLTDSGAITDDALRNVPVTNSV